MTRKDHSTVTQWRATSKVNYQKAGLNSKGYKYTETI